MNKKKTTIFLMVVFALFIVGAVFLYNGLSATTAPDSALPEAGDSVSTETDPSVSVSMAESETAESGDERVEAPDFTVLDADGNEMLLSDLRGKPVVLNFWASWCPPCKAEMPEFDKVYKELGGEVAFMMVDLVDGSQETKETGEAFIAESGFTFPVYYDVSREAAYIYGVRSIPTTLFIDQDGYVVTGAQGQISEELLRKGIDMIRGDAE